MISSAGRPRSRAISSGRCSSAQAVDGGLGHVDVVGRAQRLAEHVVDAGLFEDGAGRATGDDTGTGSGGLEQHATGAAHTDHGVDDRAAGQRHGEEVLASLLGALLDGEGHLLRLAVAQADAAVAVTDHHERGEGEATATLDHLGDTVDVDDPRLAQCEVGIVVLLAIRTPVLLHVRRRRARRRGRGSGSRRGRRPPARCRRPWPARPRACRPWRPRRCSRSDADAGRPRASMAAANVRPGVVVDHLGDDVAVGPEHGQAGTLGGADDVLADPGVPAGAADLLLLASCRSFDLTYLPALPALRRTCSST